MLELYENIKKYRKLRGLSQEDLAKRTGYNDRSSIAKIESGAVDLSYQKISLFANALGVSEGELMGNDGTSYYTDSEAVELMQHYFDRPELKILFDAARDVSKDDVLQVAALLEKLKK